jgi:hypothetical protein
MQAAWLSRYSFGRRCFGPNVATPPTEDVNNTSYFAASFNAAIVRFRLT